MSPGAASRARALRRRYISLLSCSLVLSVLTSSEKEEAEKRTKPLLDDSFRFSLSKKTLLPGHNIFLPSACLLLPDTRSLPFTGTILYSTRNEHTAVIQKYGRRKIRRESVSSFCMFGMLLVGTTVCFRVVPLFHHPVLSRIQRKCVVPGVGGITERCYDD